MGAPDTNLGLYMAHMALNFLVVYGAITTVMYFAMSRLTRHVAKNGKFTPFALVISGCFLVGIGINTATDHLSAGDNAILAGLGAMMLFPGLIRGWFLARRSS